MLKSTLLVMSLIFQLHMFSQNMVGITGLITDKNNNQFLAYVNVKVKGTSIGVSTNLQGRFYLEIPLEEFPLELEITHLGYEEKRVEIIKPGKAFYELSLTPKFFELGEVIVKYSEKDAFLSKKFHVIDYVKFKDRLVLLASRSRQLKPFIILTDMEGRPLDYSLIPRNNPIKLFKDCLGDLYLICKTYPAKVEIGRDSIKFENVPQDAYNRLMKPCVSLYKEHLIYKKYINSHKQALNYYLYTQDTTSDKLFYQIVNQGQGIPLDSLSYHQLKIVMEPSELYGATEKFNYNSKAACLDEVYAPLFVEEDTVLIFDHAGKKIRFFNQNSDLLKSSPINYMSLNHWLPYVLRDSKRESYYTSTFDNGRIRLHKIDIHTGEASFVTEIDFLWIEKLIIHDGVAYFLYRDKAENYSKKLYFKYI